MISTSSLKLIWKSSRPVLWPAIFLNTLITTHAIGSTWENGLLLSSALCCAASFGFLINDYKDIPVDRVNFSRRLETATKTELRGVRFAIATTLLSAIGLSGLLGMRGLSSVLLISCGLVLYTVYARPKLVFATVLAAALSSTPLWIPNIVFGASVSHSHGLLVVVALFILMAREVMFDARDRVGDLYGKRKTFATIFNRRSAVQISLALNTGGVILLNFILLSSHSELLPAVWIRVFLGLLFVFLLVSPSLRLKDDPQSLRYFKAFVAESRLAMLLIPVVWLVI